MKVYQAVDIRNIAVVGHGDSGKTILCEAMLLCGGQINRIGSIENGTTISDYHPGEKIRQISGGPSRTNQTNGNGMVNK